MGGKPRSKPAPREVWLSRNPFEVSRDWVAIWDYSPEWASNGWDHDYGNKGVVPCTWLDIEVPTDRPIKVRLHVEVIDE